MNDQQVIEAVTREIARLREWHYECETGCPSCACRWPCRVELALLDIEKVMSATDSEG